jgi:RNA polymerase sigma factor (sigma-70 family)
VWPDCTQEVFVRLLERVPQDSWDDALRKEGDERKELLRAIDCVKKRVQRAKTPVAYPESGVADGASLTEQHQVEDREFLAKAAEVLPARQWEILKLWATGYEASDIAEAMNMTPARVSDEKYKAIRRLREALEIEPVSVA